MNLFGWHVDKCVWMEIGKSIGSSNNYKINQQDLNKVNSIKDLGVTYNDYNK